MLRVLVVDDDPVRSARWARALVARGHEVALAPDGERAIDRFVQEPADVCLISLVLPGRDGASTAESIRLAPGGDTCVVVLLTGGVRDVAVLERARIRATAAAVAPPSASADDVADLVEETASARASRPQATRAKTRVAQDIEPTPAATRAPVDPRRRARSTEMLGGLDGEAEHEPQAEPPPRREPGRGAVGPGRAFDGRTARVTPEDLPGRSTLLAGGMSDLHIRDPGKPDVGGPRRPEAGAPARRRETAVLPQPADGQAPDAADASSHAAAAQRAAAEARAAASAAFSMESAALSVSTALAGIDDPSAQREAQDVERRARAIARGGDEGRTGDLRATPFPRLLAELGRERLTGALAIVHEDDSRRATAGDSIKKIVFFKAGVPVFVRSNVLSETLGHVLVRMGLLTPRQLEISVDRMRREGGRQGQILVAMGAITPHQLVTALQEQLRQKLFDIFSWSSGSFRFSTKVQPPPEVVSLEMGLVEAVFEGIVRKVHPSRVLTRLEPDAERFAIPDTRRVERFLSLDLVTEARRVVHAVDGTQRVRDLLGLGGNRPGAAAQVLYAMLCVDAISLADEPERRGKAQHPSGEVRTAPAPERPYDIESARQAFGRLAVLLRAGKYREALGVERGADPAEIEAAITRVMEAHKPELLPPSSPRDLRALAYQVVAQLMQAQQALVGEPEGPAPPATGGERDDEARTRALAEEPASDAPPGLDGVPRDAATRAARRPLGPQSGEHPEPMAMAPPPPPPPPLPPETPSFEADVVTVTPVRLRRPEAPAEPAAGGAARPSAPAPSGPQLNEAVERIFEAEHHFRRGESALRRGRYEQAIDALERAVAICPDEGEFLAYLGYVRYLSRPTDAELLERALGDLQRATVLAPKLDRAHLFLGRIRSAQGEKRQARAAYQKALLANPDCREALEEMRALDG